MIVKSLSHNYWLTSAHNSSIDAEGMYLPSSTETTVSDELGSYLTTLENVVEVMQDVKEITETKETKKP